MHYLIIDPKKREYTCKDASEIDALIDKLKKEFGPIFKVRSRVVREMSEKDSHAN